jgi:hypothetical protein
MKLRRKLTNAEQTHVSRSPRVLIVLWWTVFALLRKTEPSDSVTWPLSLLSTDAMVPVTWAALADMRRSSDEGVRQT